MDAFENQETTETTPPATVRGPASRKATERIVPAVRRSRGPRTLSLAELLSEAGLPAVGGAEGVLEVSGVIADSRRIRAGDLFVALRGQVHDGRDHAPDAVARGAVAVVCDEGLPEDLGVPVIVVPDAPRALAWLADRMWGRPAHALKCIAVTGTNGKTSTSWLLQAALERSGVAAGLLSSVSWRSRAGVRAAINATPAADRLHSLLHEMRVAGEDACIIEASSHGIVQGRLDGVPFKVAICTDLTGDHLEYHGSYAEYLEAKLDLFRALPRDAVAVLNADEPACELIAEETRAKVITYGVEGGGDVRARILRMDRRGIEADVRTPLGHVTLRSPLLGRHNLSNLLGALAGAIALGAEPEDAVAGLASIERIPGRLEKVPVDVPFSVFVDHAHTSEALKQVLAHVRPLTDRKLWVVFGAGGERDRAKRPRMARITELLADRVVVTSDNPRNEHPMAIIRDVMGGFAAPRSVLLEPDRRRAIRMALDQAEAGDVVLIAGKGHEAYQIINETIHPFDDRVEVRTWFDEQR